MRQHDGSGMYPFEQFIEGLFVGRLLILIPDVYKRQDLGCAIKNHSFLVNRETEITLLHASGEETVLAFFYIILDELYKLGTVAGIDIRSYANATLDNFKFNINKE